MPDRRVVVASRAFDLVYKSVAKLPSAFELSTKRVTGSQDTYLWTVHQMERSEGSGERYCFASVLGTGIATPAWHHTRT